MLSAGMKRETSYEESGKTGERKIFIYLQTEDFRNVYPIEIEHPECDPAPRIIKSLISELTCADSP